VVPVVENMNNFHTITYGEIGGLEAGAFTDADFHLFNDIR